MAPKKIKYSIIALAVVAGAIPAFAEGRQELSVTLTEAGTLNTFIKTEDVATLQKLTVAGPLNGTDLRLIRSLTGRDERWKATSGVLTDIDFTDAQFVEGGENIMVPHGMEDVENPVWIVAREDAMPEQLFSATKLQTVKLPKSVKKIYSTFADANDLTGHIVVPEGVEVLGEWAFSATAITGITLPSTLKDQNDFPTFNERAIGANVFNGCSKLESVELPAGVVKIYDSTFAGCAAMKEFTIPATVTSIGTQIFANSGVIDLYAESAKPAKASYEAFRDMNENCIVHVPVGAIPAYRQADEWKNFIYILDANTPESSVSVTTTATVVDGKTVGELFIVSGDEKVTSIELTIGETVIFEAVPAEGYVLDYITRVADGSDDSVDAGDSYTAVREDVVKGAIFKGVFRKTGGIDAVGADSAAPVYYDLQGRRVDNPDKGIYIVRRGSETFKAVF